VPCLQDVDETSRFSDTFGVGVMFAIAATLLLFAKNGKPGGSAAAYSTTQRIRETARLGSATSKVPAPRSTPCA
jgi:hypothetical protein